MAGSLQNVSSDLEEITTHAAIEDFGDSSPEPSPKSPKENSFAKFFKSFSEDTKEKMRIAGEKAAELPVFGGFGSAAMTISRTLKSSWELTELSGLKSVFSSQTMDAMKEISEILKALKSDSDVGFYEFPVLLSGFVCLQDVCPPPLSPHVPVPIAEPELKHRVNRLKRFVKFSSAAYGRRFLRLTGIAKLMDPHFSSNDKQAAHHTKIPISDIICYDWVTSIYRPVYFLSLDHSTHSIVLSLRGTLSLHDALTDLCCECAEIQSPFDSNKKHRAHKGMLQGATAISDLLFEKVKSLANEYPHYEIALVGHSLGAGVASLLTVLWMNHFPLQSTASTSAPIVETSSVSSTTIESQFGNLQIGENQNGTRTRVHCYAFGCPAVTDPELCRQLIPHISSVISPFDLVPRLSFASVSDLKHALHHIKKERIALDAIKARTKLGGSGKSTSQEKLADLNEKREWCEQNMSQIREDRSGIEDRVYPPGLLLQISEISEKNSSSFHVIQKDCLDFSEIWFDSDMVSNHMPNIYEKQTLNLNFPGEEKNTDDQLSIVVVEQDSGSSFSSSLDSLDQIA